MHRTVMRAFEGKRDQAGVLFRVDVARDSGLPTLLVQSQEAPDWSGLGANGYLLQPAPDGSPNPACKECDVKLTAGQVLAFRLNANPTFKREGKRLAWLKEEDQIRWLQRKGESGGFRLLQALAAPRGMTTGRKHEEQGSGALSWFVVRFEGVMQVTDAGACVQALESGVGASKSLGCGLLSLAPAR
jgi:CRISPR system Cascade subunit CasE